MSENAFVGKRQQPNDAELEQALGSAMVAWDRFLEVLADGYDAGLREWKCYSLKLGWALRVAHKKRTVVWLSPYSGFFYAGFVLGDSAMESVRVQKLPKPVVQALTEAKKYAEGTGVRIKVKSSRELPTLRKFVECKLAR